MFSSNLPGFGRYPPIREPTVRPRYARTQKLENALLRFFESIDSATVDVTAGCAIVAKKYPENRNSEAITQLLTPNRPKNNPNPMEPPSTIVGFLPILSARIPPKIDRFAAIAMPT